MSHHALQAVQAGFADEAVPELVDTARAEGADADAARGALALLLRLRQGSAA